MDFKQPKFQISLDSIQSVVHRLKEKGAALLEVEELFICLTTLGFQEVCKTLGVEWGPKHEKQALERIKKNGIEVPWLTKNQPPSTQYGPLLVHCARGDVAKVHQRIIQIKDIVKKTPKDQLPDLRQAVDANKRTALHIAAKEGYQVLVEYLLEERFSANARDRELKTPLHYSCIASAEVVSSILISKCESLAKDNKGSLALHYAVCGNSSKTVNQLLEVDSRTVECKDYAGKSPLHYAVLSTTENQIDIIRMLLEHGARVNQTDNEGKTALHYASEHGKSRCIPILLKNKANPTLRDSLKKSAIDLASNERIKKLLETYGDDKKTPISEVENKEFEEDYESKLQNQKRIEKMKNVPPVTGTIGVTEKSAIHPTSNAPVLGGDINQISAWLRQKLFVLLKKLQESGVRAKFHIKRPYIFTGSWLENVDSIEDLYSIFGEVSGPEVAMRVFNVLCPYQKKLSTGLSKMEAFEGFFGENWFGTKPVEQIKKVKGEDKLRRELGEKDKAIEQLKIQLAALQTEITQMEGEALNLNDQLRQYKRMEEDIKKEKIKSAQQYSQILKMTNENEELKKQVAEAYAGDDEVEKLNKKLSQQKKANEQLTMQIESLKSYQAAARRKCGKMFLKALQSPEGQLQLGTDNLYDDDSIVRLYEQLEGNPPSLLKRLQAVDRNGDEKLSVEEFTTFLERLKMLPQDILALNRIVGFVSGRKHLSFEEFKGILEQRPQLRVQWEKKLIKKLKDTILASEVGSVDKLFQLLDADNSGSISLEELRSGLENYNIFINQSDLSNLYSLLDADKSGTVSLHQFQSLLGKEGSAKVIPPLDPASFSNQVNEPAKSKANSKKSEREEIQQQHDVSERNQQEQEQKGEEQEEQKEGQERQEDEPSQQEGTDRNSQHNPDDGQQDNKSEHGQQDEQKENLQDNMDALAGDSPDPEMPEVEEAEDPRKYASSDNRQEEQAGEDEIGPRISGVFKLQARFCENLMESDQLEKVAIRFRFGKEEIVKVGDLSKKKWEIAVKFQVSNKLESTIPNIGISVWKNRNFEEPNYLGEVEIDSRALMETPDEWVVNGPVELEARQFEREVSGSIGVQARWKAEEEQPQPQ